MDRKEIADRLRRMAEGKRMYAAVHRTQPGHLAADMADYLNRDADALEAAAEIVGRDG